MADTELTAEEVAGIARRWRLGQFLEILSRRSGLRFELADPPTGRMADADLFEEWLVERYRNHVTSERFRRSAEYHYLRAEWEHYPAPAAHLRQRG